LTDSGKGVIARLKDAATEGLNPATIRCRILPPAASPDQLAEAELKLTASMLDYAATGPERPDALGRRSRPTSVSRAPDRSGEVLANISTAKTHPRRSTATTRRTALQGTQGQARRIACQGDGPVIQIAEAALAYKAATKKQGEVAPEDPRVPQLRAQAQHRRPSDSTHYDAKVAAAVRKFQEGVDLKPTGVLDDRTVKATTARSATARFDTVLVNMEPLALAAAPARRRLARQRLLSSSS